MVAKNQLKITEETSAKLIVRPKTHYPLESTVSENYRPLMVETAREIEEEYNCRTPTEKILAELTSGAYIRIIMHSKPVNLSTEIDYLSHYKNGYYSMESKELDRAYRQFTMAISMLKQIKNPDIEINVKAKTAFVSQNQQFNATVISKDKINDPK